MCLHFKNAATMASTFKEINMTINYNISLEFNTLIKNLSCFRMVILAFHIFVL